MAIQTSRVEHYSHGNWSAFALLMSVIFLAPTTVPAEFFDDLLTALDSPAQPNKRLSRAAQRGHDLVTG